MLLLTDIDKNAMEHEMGIVLRMAKYLLFMLGGY